MTTRLNNSMIMVHLIRSLLTNLNSMIAIETKYVELCKYAVAYVGLNFLQRSSAVAEGTRNACRSDFNYVSPGDAWCEGSAVQPVLYYGLVLVELVRSEGGGSLPLRENFAWNGSAPPTTFARRSQSAG